MGERTRHGDTEKKANGRSESSGFHIPVKAVFLTRSARRDAEENMDLANLQGPSLESSDFSQFHIQKELPCETLR